MLSATATAPTASAVQALIMKLPQTAVGGTPPKNCVLIMSGSAPTRSASTKKSRPIRLPITICTRLSGVVSRISHVCGFASCAMAPAMKSGVSTQMRVTSTNESAVNAVAPRCASSRSDELCPTMPKSIATMRSARNPLRIHRCLVRRDPLATMRRMMGLVGPRSDAQRASGMRAS